MEISAKYRPFAIRDGVYEAIRTALYDGQFAPGESINERELAEKLKVSRGPLREALLVLTAEGLMTHTQNYGFSRVRLSDEDMAEIEQVRVPLEAMALRLGRERVTEEDLKGLATLRDQIMEALRKQDLSANQRADEAFHTRIAELSGNRWLLLSLQRILVPYFAFVLLSALLSLKSGSNRELLVQEQHDAYLNYLKGTTSLSAEQCVELHLGRRH
jgi:DNA-binding GntR family transcriptional regulator